MATVNKINSELDRIGKLLTKLESKVSGGGSSGSSSVAVEAFEELLDSKLSPFMKTSKDLGGDIALAAENVSVTFKGMLTLIQKASGMKKPGDADFNAMLLEHVISHIKTGKEFEKKKFRSKQFNHIKSVSEGLACCQWVAIPQKPFPFIKDMIPSAEYSTNKILREFRGKDDRHVTWVKEYIALLKEMMAYVKEHHTTGLTFQK